MCEENKTPTPTTPPQADEWRDIAEKVCRETDPEKMTHLVQDLCDRIDRLRAQRHLRGISSEEREPALDGKRSE